jgi:8-oxo-dGTP pyrophosphatase MutT (NUDIX family)
MDDTYQEVNDPAITVKFGIPEQDAAIGLFLDENDRFLMGWSNKYNGWHLVGGKVDTGESIQDCFIRETMEEIGVTITRDDLNHVAQESQID